MKRFNERIAVLVANGVSTMACVWLFLVWSLLPLIWPAVRDGVFYVSGGVLQLVLLPVIMVGQKIVSRSSDAMAKEQHDAVMEMLQDVREDHQELRKLVEELG